MTKANWNSVCPFMKDRTMLRVWFRLSLFTRGVAKIDLMLHHLSCHASLFCSMEKELTWTISKCYFCFQPVRVDSFPFPGAHDSFLHHDQICFGFGGKNQSWKSTPRAWKTTSHLLIETRHNESILWLFGSSCCCVPIPSFLRNETKMDVYFDELPEIGVQCHSSWFSKR